MILDGDKNSFEGTVKTINKFGKTSGLFLNAGKTSAIWLGNKRNFPVKYMPHLQMEWNPPKFKILGIWFSNDLKVCEVLIFCDKFSAIRALCKVWLTRQITPLSRVEVLKALILRLFTYGRYCQTNQTTLLMNCRRQCFSSCLFVVCVSCV